MNKLRLAGLALTLSTGLALVAAPALACGPDSNMTHVGTVASIDAATHTLVLLDAQTGKHIAFRVTAEQLKQVTAKARVVIRYSEDGDQLVADQIDV